MHSAPPSVRPAPRVTAVVVSFNTRELTTACIDSFLAESRGLEAELVVVDNASEDGSAAEIRAAFPGVRLIELAENVGFGAACNLGARDSSAERLLMLNPDTLVLDGAIAELVRFADERPEARLWGGRTLFPDRTLNPASCWARPTPWSALACALGLSSAFPGHRLTDPEGYGGWKRDRVREVDIVSGCFLLIDRALWRELGGFHPDFFMYGEDADLSLRARAKGARPLIDPAATIVHVGGASERDRAEQMIRLFTGKAQLYRKFETPLAARFMLRCLDLWALHRRVAYGALGRVLQRYEARARAWREVWRRRAEWRRGFASTRPYRAADREDHAACPHETS